MSDNIRDAGVLHRNFKTLKSDVNEFISLMKELHDGMENFKFKCNVARGAGTTLSGVGAVATTVAVFTGPIGWLAGGVLFGITAAGAATSITTEVVDSLEIDKCKDRIRRVLDNYDSRMVCLQKLTELLAQNVFFNIFNYNVSFKHSVEYIFGVNTKLSKIKECLSEYEMEKLKNLENEKYKFLKQLLIAVKHREDAISASVSIAGSSIVAATTVGATAFKQIGNTTARRVLARSAAGAGIIFTGIEVGMLVRSCLNKHPSSEVIDEILVKMRDVSQELERILKEIDEAIEVAKEKLRLLNLNGNELTVTAYSLM